MPPSNSFQKGNKAAPGGARKGAGRKTNHQRAVRKEAAVLAKEYMERCLPGVLAAYKQLAAGRKVKHRDPATGKILWTEVEADAPTTRHFIDKLVPSVRTETDLTLHGKVEIFTNVVPNLGPPKEPSEDEG